MRTAYILAMVAMAATSADANATCKNGGTDWPTCTKPQPSTPSAPSTSTNTLSSSSSSNASAQAGASASVSGSSTAHGGSGGSMSYEEFSRSSMYVLPAPVQAAPLPPGLCPQGDSISWSIGWNFFSYARSSTRTELDCLDRVLASIKAMPTAPVIQAPLLAHPPAPIQAPAQPASQPKPAAKAKRKPSPASAPQPAAQCMQTEAPRCERKS